MVYGKETITIRHTADRHGSIGLVKDSDERVLPLFSQLRALFDSVYRNAKVVSIARAGPVFRNAWGRQYSYEYMRARFHEAREAAGITRLPMKNAFRASFATQWRGDIYLLMQALGHEDLETTRKYRANQPEHLRAIFEEG